MTERKGPDCSIDYTDQLQEITEVCEKHVWEGGSGGGGKVN